MSRKRKILDILGMILGVLLVIVNGMMVGLEYMYQVGDKIYMLGTMRDKMIPLVFGVFCFLLGVFLIYRGPRDFRRYRRYQLFKSICAGREYVEIEEIAREGRCSPSSALRSTKQMLKKHLLTGAVLDVQEGMILFGEEVKASYQKHGVSGIKNRMCTEQSGYLWKSRRHFFWENSRQKNCRSWQEN